MRDLDTKSTSALANRDIADLMTETGIAFPSDFTVSEWVAMGPFIQLEAVASQWRLGDWMIWGENRLSEEFYQHVEVNWYDPSRVAKCMRTCQSFPHDQRRSGMSFEHHEATTKVDSLAERNRWLDTAQENGWTPGELATGIRNSLAIETGVVEKPPELEEPKATTEALLRFSVRVPISCAAEAEELKPILEADLRSTLTANGVVVKGVEYGVSYS